ncbi:MAG: hypothetical protein IKK52_03700 [Alphaproteobacteria bacterium]|nr:hypothetical protein [Alphaproteobacteria bacterium]
MSKISHITTVAIILSWAFGAGASVIPEYAANSYNEHPLSRAEKKCIDEGYSVTYASCNEQTAPADRCPHHDDYYRSCSQEQWCRNNNYTFLPEDCKLPTYPVKKCSNDFEIYRICQKDEQKACKDKGYSSASECALSDERCEFDDNYGKCCDSCPDFPYVLKDIPEGYVSTGETCKTCEGVIKTKVKEAACEDFVDCPYGPASKQTAYCLQGAKVLYNDCKTAETLCKEKGFLKNSCDTSEDAEACPEFAELNKCRINCYKLALKVFPNSDIVNSNVINPDLSDEKTELRSLYGNVSDECVGTNIPTVMLNINKDNVHVYNKLFNRDIKNINFLLNFEEALTLEANGKLENVRIKVEGTPSKCVLQGQNISITGKVSLQGEGDICADLNIADMSKFTTSQNIVGNVTMGSNAQLGVKGDVNGFIQTSAYSEVLVKGKVSYKNKQNNSADAQGIIFGCNTRAKISGGIKVDTANILIRQYALIDTPSIDMVSTGTSDSGAASIHMYKYAKITSILGDSEYMLNDNVSDVVGDCDDKFIIHKASSIDNNGSIMSLNTADSLDGKWQCRALGKLQMRCN